MMNRIIILFVLLFSIITSNAFATDYYQQNPETSYSVVIDDEAKILKTEEIGKLSDEMFSLTQYGNIVFLTTNRNSLPSYRIAHDYYHDLFSTDNGTVLLINMRERIVYIYSDGENSKLITDAKSISITNNIYRELKNEKYYDGAVKGFSQIKRVLARTIDRGTYAVCGTYFGIIFN